MLRQKMLLGMLFAISLSSCGSSDVEESVDFNQKTVQLYLKTDENGRRYIDEERSVCFRRRYRYSLGYIGSISDVEDLDITACNKITGNSPLNYKKKIDWLEALRIEASQWFDDKSNELLEE